MVSTGTPDRPACNCQGDWWGGDHVTGCPAKAVEPPPKRIEVKLMTAWLPAPPVELIDDLGPGYDRVYPGLRAALVEHEPHGPYATAVQNSAFGYRSARCSVCDVEIWKPEETS